MDTFCGEKRAWLVTSLTKNAQRCQSGNRRILKEDILNYHFLQKNLYRTLLYAYTIISLISLRLLGDTTTTACL